MIKNLTAAAVISVAMFGMAAPATASACPTPGNDPIGYASCVAEPVLCLAFDEAAPLNVRDIVVVEPGGDIYVVGEAFFNCPPY